MRPAPSVARAFTSTTTRAVSPATVARWPPTTARAAARTARRGRRRARPTASRSGAVAGDRPTTRPLSPLLRRRQLGAATPRAAFTEWWWPPSPTIFRTIPAGYRSFEHVVVPEVEPGPGGAYLWAHEFKLVGGEGGF